jgi:hypothetical protein
MSSTASSVDAASTAQNGSADRLLHVRDFTVARGGRPVARKVTLEIPAG